jgi:hypothetical protein
MSFDIHGLDSVEPGSDKADKALEAYQRTLLGLFASSPEGVAHTVRYPQMGYWAESLLFFSFSYLGTPLPQMRLSDVEEVVTEIFPRKVSLRSPQDAQEVIPELLAFWEFLQREYALPVAPSVIARLRELEPNYTSIMNDSARFGMAKSLFALAQRTGFDMTKQDEANAFIEFYNSQLSKDSRASGTSKPPGKGNSMRKLRRKAARNPRKRKKN